MKQQPTTRHAKLHGKFRRRVTYWGESNTHKVVPWLNVNGVWLDRAGFKVGTEIEITVEKNLLIIKKRPAHGDKRD